MTSLLFVAYEQMRIHIGMYVVFLKEWFDVFPRSNFYILRTEDYEKDMLLQLTAIFDFLKVGEWRYMVTYCH